MAEPDFEDADDRRAIVTPSLRLAFRWTGDRWSHTLEAARSGIELARSFEGSEETNQAARVVSPAYQQFHWRKVEGGAEAMLVGQSGPHHFSAVFAIAEADGCVVVAVDLADRCRPEIEVLACTYLVPATSGDLRDAGPGQIAWDRDDPPDESSGRPGRLTFAADPPSLAALAEAGRRAVRVQAVAEVVPGRRTHRCSYRWTWQAPTR